MDSPQPGGTSERIEQWLDSYWERRFPRAPLITAYWGWEKVDTWITPDYFPVFPSDEAFAAINDARSSAEGVKSYALDGALALEAMKHSATRDHLGLKYYRDFGFIPSELEGQSVSRTLEYAFDDWCIAQMARSMGRVADFDEYIFG